MQFRAAFTLIEAAVLCVLLAACVMVALVVLPPHRGHRTANRMQNNTQLRGIHQTMVMFAQGNNGYFPGLDPEGLDAAVGVERRYQVLFDNNYFTGEYAISPVEVRTVWTTGVVTTAYYSYAMLQLPNSGGRRDEWRETLSAEAPVMADRNLGAETPRSIWSPDADVGRPHRGRLSLMDEDGWQGSVAYNDNHVVFEATHRIPSRFNAVVHPVDDLFTAASDDDAYLIHAGNE